MLRPLALALALLVSASALAGEAGLKAGDQAPDFSLPDAAGKPLKLSSLKGQVVLIDFWATYCKPCREELPLLDKTAKKYQKQGLAVLGVDIDPEAKDAKEFLAKSPVSFTVLFDEEDATRELFGGPEMPALYLLDRSGKLLAFHRGALAEGDPFFTTLEKGLAEKK